MKIGFHGKSRIVMGMKFGILFLSLCFLLADGASGQNRRPTSLLNNESGVVYLDQIMDKRVELDVVKQSPVFSDRNGKIRLGFLKADQKVKVEAITDKVYRVRGQGLSDGIVGWVAPSAFASSDPDFVKRFKEIYDRQILVRELIDANQIAIGMTLKEVEQSVGKPTKTSQRKTEKGNSGLWEYIEYKEIKHYTTRVDPVSGRAYRVLSQIEQIEKERTNIEYENDIVTAIEESEDRRRRRNLPTLVPPFLPGW
jgi:hypothetical protein